VKQPLDKLVKKTRIRSAEAVTISVLVHLILILVAGSFVAVRYVKKRDAELNVVMREPKLERRQLQMPETLQRVRKTSRRPKIISTQAAVSDTEFSVPDLGGIGGFDTQAYEAPLSRSGYDFRALSKGIGVSAPDFKFLGIRGEGEKVLFVIDGSADMISESCGGVAACEYIKSELDKVLTELPPSVLFNVMLYDGQTVAEFRSRMVPVSERNRTALAGWIAPALGGSGAIGLSAEQNTYIAPVIYDTAVGDETRGWARALQAALEQRPDTVFVVGREWGRFTLSEKKWKRLLRSVLWLFLVGQDGLDEDGREVRDGMIIDASVEISVEEEEQQHLHEPPPFVRNLAAYIQYSTFQLFDHIDTVARQVYEPVQQSIPWVNFVRLVSEEEDGAISDPSNRNMKDLVACFDGELGFLNGQDAARRMREGRIGEEEVSEEIQEVAEVPESKIEFFGERVEGARFAFVLDVSPDIFDESLGGVVSVDFLKGQLRSAIHALQPGTLFNVFVCDGPALALFRPELVPSADADEVDEWLAAIGMGLTLEQSNYTAQAVYDTAMGSDIQGLPLAVQAAMEQHVDSILVTGAGLGHLPVNEEKANRILEFSIIQKLSQRKKCSNCGFVTESKNPLLRELGRNLKFDQGRCSELISNAVELIQEEADQRKEVGLPMGFVNDITDYLEYLPSHITDHLQVVAEACYPVDKEEQVLLPQLLFTLLSEADGAIERQQLRDIRSLLKPYDSEPIIFSGTDTEKEIRKLNRMLDLYP